MPFLEAAQNQEIKYETRKHTASIPRLSGVSLRTVSFSSTAIISGCNKSSISDNKRLVPKMLSGEIFFFPDTKNINLKTESSLYLLSVASCKSKSPISCTSIYGEDNTINITCQYATLLQGLRVLYNVLWSIA